MNVQRTLEDQGAFPEGHGSWLPAICLITVEETKKPAAEKTIRSATPMKIQPIMVTALWGVPSPSLPLRASRRA